MSLFRAAREVQARRFVEQGAKLLDELHPDWYTHIDLRRLDLFSCADCIVGQLFPVYTEHPASRLVRAAFDAAVDELLYTTPTPSCSGSTPWTGPTGSPT